MQRIKPYIMPIIILTLFVVAYYPALNSIVKKWNQSDDYTHAFFTVPIVIYMIWLKRNLLTEGKGQPVLGLFFVALSAFLYLVSVQLQIPTIMYIVTVFTVISGLVYFAGFLALKEMAIPIMLLFLVIPIPNQLLSMVTASLQLKVSYASEIVIQLFSVPLFREGNVLHIPDRTFQIVEACSGLRSLISLMTLSLILGYFTLIKSWSVFLLFMFSIPIAIFVNVVRVVFLILAYYYVHVDLAVGLTHTVFGLVLFLIGLGLLYSFQRLLELWETKK